MGEYKHSAYQETILKDIDVGKGNTTINAVAGSGKTYICETGIRSIPSVYQILMSAFGHDIAEELKKRSLPRNCTIATYNAFGWRIAQKHSKGPIELNKLKTYLTLQHMVMKVDQSQEEEYKRFKSFAGPIDRLVSLLKGRLIVKADEALALIPDLVEHYGIDVPNDPTFDEILIDTYMKCVAMTHMYDFNDQIFQPLIHQMPVPSFDYVFVDEFQDTNDMQGELMARASRYGRFFTVGDPDQSIFGFAGATPDNFNKFKAKFNAKELPLSICYRCPKKIIEQAKLIVPRIEAAPTAIDGTYDTISTPEFKKRVVPGDFVICRTVAPLVRRCLEGIQEGVPGKVLGREIGGDLEYLIDRATKGEDHLPIWWFKDKLNAYVMQKLEGYKLTDNENGAQLLEDKRNSLIWFMEGCNDVRQLKDKIDKTFVKGAVGVVLYMSGHKCKGLECEQNVYCLRPDLIPHPLAKKDWMVTEEQRLKYVILTRTKNGFFWVLKEKGEK